jgi:hypothetical protein
MQSLEEPRKAPVSPHMERHLQQRIEEIQIRQRLKDVSLGGELAQHIHEAQRLVQHLDMHRPLLEQAEMSHATEAVLPGAAVLNMMLQDMRSHLNAIQKGSPEPLESLAILKGRVEQMESSLRVIIQKGLKSQLGSGAATPCMRVSHVEGLHYMTFGESSAPHLASDDLAQNDRAVSALGTRAVSLSERETELASQTSSISKALKNLTKRLTTLQSDLNKVKELTERMAEYDEALTDITASQYAVLYGNLERISDIQRWKRDLQAQCNEIYSKHQINPQTLEEFNKKILVAQQFIAHTNIQEKELSFALKQEQIAQAMETLRQATRLRHSLQGTRRALEQFQGQVHTERGMGGRLALALKEKIGLSEKRTETITQLVRRATETETQLEKITQAALAKAGL